MALFRTLETPRLCLREPRPADAEAVFAAYAGHAEVLRYLGWRSHASVEDTRRQLGYDTHRWLKHSAWVWMLAQREPGAPAFGQVELVPASYPAEESHALRLGYVMGEALRGQGLMSEAVHAVLVHAFDRLQPVWRIEALCDVDNPASARLLERVGMQREGRVRRGVVHPNLSAEPRDAWLYALTRGDPLPCPAAPASATPRAGAAQSR